MTEDEQHLEILSIFHFVVAGIAALIGLFPALHLVFGLAMAFGSFGSSPGFGGPETLIAWIFVLVPTVMIAAAWAYAACLVVAGRYLRQRTRHTFCLVMAAISCVFVPFGTVLGVFTILVLMRPSVREMFGIDLSASTPPTTP